MPTRFADAIGEFGSSKDILVRHGIGSPRSLGGDSTKLLPIPVALLLRILADVTTAIAQTDHVVNYHATISDVKSVYGVAPPVSHVKPGKIQTPTAIILSSFSLDGEFYATY
jgi:hypothetical protein